MVMAAACGGAGDACGDSSAIKNVVMVGVMAANGSEEGAR